VRYWEDFRVGDETVHGSHEITTDEIVGFAREFDPQPFHIDRDADGPFGGLIASGWHTAALYMGMFVRNVLLETASMGSPGVETSSRIDRRRARASEASLATPTRRGRPVWPAGRLNQRGEVVMRMRARGHIARRPA
jgi:acyl dehydratase